MPAAPAAAPPLALSAPAAAPPEAPAPLAPVAEPPPGTTVEATPAASFLKASRDLSGAEGLIESYPVSDHSTKQKITTIKDGGRKSSLLVNDHNHTGLTVLGLCTVHPDGLGVVDHNAVSRGHAHGLAGSGGLEAGVEAGDVASLADRFAGLVEGGLRHGVVAVGELELHDLSGVGGEFLGCEFLSVVYADGDHMHLDAGVALGCCEIQTSQYYRPHN